MTDLVCIKTYLDKLDAELAKGVLENQGIEAIILSDEPWGQSSWYELFDSNSTVSKSVGFSPRTAKKVRIASLHGHRAIFSLVSATKRWRIKFARQVTFRNIARSFDK